MSCSDGSPPRPGAAPGRRPVGVAFALAADSLPLLRQAQDYRPGLAEPSLADAEGLGAAGWGCGDGEVAHDGEAAHPHPTAARRHAAKPAYPSPIEGEGQLTCKSPRPSRRTSRTAFADLPPEPDDPLLGFAPYIHRAPRRNSITPERQRAFIAALAATGIVTQAARAIGASLEALYRLRHQPGAEGFAAAWNEAFERGTLRLEDCALELAIRGEELPIASGGKLLGTYRKHNFAHIRFVLGQRRASRWGQAGARLPDPDEPAFAALRERIIAEHEAAKQAARTSRFRQDDAFLHKLNAAIERKRQEAIAAGVLELLPDGRARAVDPELRREDDAAE